MLAASIAVIRVPLPRTRMRRGLHGRAHLVDYFDRQISLRRARGGEDLFSCIGQALAPLRDENVRIAQVILDKDRDAEPVHNR